MSTTHLVQVQCDIWFRYRLTPVAGTVYQYQLSYSNSYTWVSIMLASGTVLHLVEVQSNTWFRFGVTPDSLRVSSVRCEGGGQSGHRGGGTEQQHDTSLVRR